MLPFPKTKAPGVETRTLVLGRKGVDDTIVDAVQPPLAPFRSGASGSRSVSRASPQAEPDESDPLVAFRYTASS